MKRFNGSVLVIFFLISGIISAQAAHKLAYKLKKGETYRYLITNNTDMTQTAMGQEMKIKMEQRIIARYFVEDVTKEGNIVIVASMDSGMIRQSMPMKDTTVVLTDLVGKKSRLTYDKTGRVLSKKMIDTTGSEMAMAMIQQAQFYILPTEAISDKWSAVSKDSTEMMGGKIYNTADINFTIQGNDTKAGKSCLKIPLTGKINTNGKANMMGMDLFIEGTGKLSGVFNFSEKEGVMTYSETTTDLNMTMATTGENNMIIPITNSSKLVVTLLDK